MLNTPFAPWPCFREEEADAVRRVLLSNRVNYWTGEEGRRFEEAFAAWCGCRHAAALSNGTVALELALKACGIGPGDEVIVSPRSFVASASAIVLCGARPVFADVDRESQNITAATIRTVLTPQTKAIICVHLAGWPCDMDPILELARQHKLMTIEDCAQAHGAKYKGRAVGTIGDIGAWSFCQDKIMTTGGEGGMITTNDAKLFDYIFSFKDHGKSWNRQRASKSEFNWMHHTFGTNARMTEMQAAIGRLQLKQMSAWHAGRTAHASRFTNVCKRHPLLRVPEIPHDCVHAWYRFYVFVNPERLAPKWTRHRLVETFMQAGVPCYQGSCPEIYREKAFVDAGFAPANRLPVAHELGETSLAFLVHPNLSTADIEKTCHVINSVLPDASV